MKQQKEIQVEVIYTEGYETRFTEACLQQIALMEKEQTLERKEVEVA